ncbi:MAG: hypothetical protein EXR72_17615 [Myxococcales bacterium]|nr:hypothetical protein [Myxococcales bacterium]
MALKRGYVAGNFGLELDGSPNAGWLGSCEGGMGTAEVIQEKIGPDHLRHKHLSTTKYEDIGLTFGSGMSKEFWLWLQQSLNQDYVRHNGAVVASNFDMKETSRLAFYSALITEVGFPMVSGSSKDPVRVNVKLSPEYTKFSVSPNGGQQVTGSKRQDIQQRWHCSDFRFKIDGLNAEDCKSVSQVEAIVIKQKVVELSLGEERGAMREPVQIEYPNIVFTVPESHAGTFLDWYNDFVIKGNCGDEKEKTGSLEFLTPNLKETLLTLNFKGLGIFKFTPDKGEAGSEKIRSVRVEMYCEKIELVYGAKATWA